MTSDIILCLNSSARFLQFHSEQKRMCRPNMIISCNISPRFEFHSRQVQCSSEITIETYPTLYFAGFDLFLVPLASSGSESSSFEEIDGKQIYKKFSKLFPKEKCFKMKSHRLIFTEEESHNYLNKMEILIHLIFYIDCLKTSGRWFQLQKFSRVKSLSLFQTPLLMLLT